VRSYGPFVAFGLSLTAIYAVSVSIVARLPLQDSPELIAGAVTLGLTVLVPFLYYLLLARPCGWPVITVVPVFLASVLIAQRLLPEDRHQMLDLVSYGAALAELTVVVMIVVKGFQLRQGYREASARGTDVYESLRESAQQVLGETAGGAVAYETTLFYYAGVGWWRSADSDDGSFSVHRASAYVPLMIAMMIAVVVETVAIHLLVRLWSPTVAWVLTALSLYALVWLIGDIHAVRLKPVRVSTDRLLLRIGLRWSISVPFDLIESVSTVAGPSSDAPDEGYLKAVLLGEPNRRIQLRQPVAAVGLYGLTRRVSTIDLHLDEPERFDAALAGARET
jgi:hypothetical protein